MIGSDSFTVPSLILVVIINMCLNYSGFAEIKSRQYFQDLLINGSSIFKVLAKNNIKKYRFRLELNVFNVYSIGM